MPRRTSDTRNARRGLYLLTGPSAAGKTTVARLLARRFPRGVHLDGDFFRRSIVSGRHEMSPSASPEALDQLRLRHRLAARSADEYVANGFTVVLEDVIAGPMLTEVVAMLATRPLHLVVLLPDAQSLVAREAGREQSGYGAWTVEALRRVFAVETPRIGTWLDTSGQTPDQTVDAILHAPALEV